MTDSNSPDSPHHPAPVLFLEVQATSLLEVNVERGVPDAIERVLAEYPEIASQSESLLELIYLEYVLREERGESPLATDYVDRFPALNDELKRLFEVDRAARGSHDAEAALTYVDGDTWSSLVGGTLPRKLGRYLLIEELGRGGMGVVYRTKHNLLDRFVALKTIGIAGDQGAATAARFVNEARITASLQHPNIVQLFESGTADGIPFFTMELVTGGNLYDLLRDGPLEPRIAAQTMLTLAKAVQFAHDHGVLHRDLKPANVLLAPSSSEWALPLRDKSTSYELKISDFGLAKWFNATVENTRAGLPLGTPSYMAPEQVDSTAAVDPRSDIYSLGAILYHLLTGKPPFQAATALETLHQVRYDDLIPVRTLQGSTPKDLETICMTCLAKDPQRRYATADLLAEDLKRFCDGKTIRMRPAGVAEKSFKWMRRNPLPSFLLLAVFSALTVISILWYRAEAYRIQASQASRSSRQAIEQTLSALRVMTSTIVVDNLSNQAELTPAERSFVLSISEMYDSLSEIAPGDRDSRIIRAEGLLNGGRLQLTLTDFEEAAGKIEIACQLYEELYNEKPTAENFAIYIYTLELCSEAFFEFDRWEEAVTTSDKLIEVCEENKFSASDPLETQRRLAIAAAYRQKGHLHLLRSEREESLRCYSQAKSILELMLHEDATNKSTLKTLSGTLRAMSDLVDDTEEQLGLITRSIAMMRTLISEGYDVNAGKKSLAWALYDQSYPLEVLDQLPQAIDGLNEGLKMMEQIADEYPALYEFHSIRGVLLRRRADLQMALKKLDAAMVDYDASDFILTEAVQVFPKSYQNNLALLRVRMGKVNAYIAMGDSKAARSAFENAQQALLDLRENCPNGEQAGIDVQHHEDQLKFLASLLTE